jgi:hypothetical protein
LHARQWNSFFNIQKDHGMALSPNITSFSGANGSRITVDGESSIVQNANQSWSLTEPDTNTLQFSVHSGDHWSTTGWSDLVNDAGAERSEIAFSPNYTQGTQINVGYQLMVQPGSANTASWLLLNQMHATTEGPPPFAVYMDGEHMEVILRYKAPGQTTYKEVVAYRDPNPIVRGHSYDMNIQVNFDPSGNGYLNVWRDGVEIVKYQGAIGFAGAAYYWKEGIYRAPAPETITANHAHDANHPKRRADSNAGVRFTGDGNRACRRYHHIDARLHEGRDRRRYAYAVAR